MPHQISWDYLKNEKQTLIEDLLASIDYTPSRENDLLAFMKQYIKANTDERPQLLENLRACMEEREYPNPFNHYIQPTASGIKQIDGLLDEFINMASGKKLNTDTITESVENLVRNINIINAKCHFIDNWRREKLCDIINQAAVLAGLDFENDITYCIRSW